jgi:acyl carrier protein
MGELLKKYLSEELLISFETDVDEDSDLFQLGFLDSYSYIKLIRFIETTFDLQFEAEEMLSTVTTSLSGLVMLIEQKKGVGIHPRAEMLG